MATSYRKVERPIDFPGMDFLEDKDNLRELAIFYENASLFMKEHYTSKELKDIANILDKHLFPNKVIRSLSDDHKGQDIYSKPSTYQLIDLFFEFVLGTEIDLLFISWVKSKISRHQTKGLDLDRFKKDYTAFQCMVRVLTMELIDLPLNLGRSEGIDDLINYRLREGK